MAGLVMLLAGAFAAAAPAPSLPDLQNPSITYRDCIAAVARTQPNPRVEIIGAGSCREPRDILRSAIHYLVAVNWSAIGSNDAETARIDAEIDSSTQSIMRSYEMELQRWLDPRASVKPPNRPTAIGGPGQSLRRLVAAARRCGDREARVERAPFGAMVVYIPAPVESPTAGEPFGCVLRWLQAHHDLNLGFVGNEASAP